MNERWGGDILLSLYTNNINIVWVSGYGCEKGATLP
jgi:hypothetical protein